MQQPKKNPHRKKRERSGGHESLIFRDSGSAATSNDLTFEAEIGKAAKDLRKQTKAPWFKRLRTYCTSPGQIGCEIENDDFEQFLDFYTVILVLYDGLERIQPSCLEQLGEYIQEIRSAILRDKGKDCESAIRASKLKTLEQNFIVQESKSGWVLVFSGGLPD